MVEQASIYVASLWCWLLICKCMCLCVCMCVCVCVYYTWYGMGVKSLGSRVLGVLLACC
jgi:hypothetical protein